MKKKIEKNELTILANKKGYTVVECLVELGICMSTFKKHSSKGAKKFDFFVKQIGRLEDKKITNHNWKYKILKGYDYAMINDHGQIMYGDDGINWTLTENKNE